MDSQILHNYDMERLANHELPFFNYIAEDKSHYPTARSKGFIDPDNDFLIGESGGFLLNIDFIFVDTYKFTEAARFYEKHRKYHYGDYSDPIARRWWGQEAKRRRYGMIAKCKVYHKDLKEYFNHNTTDARREELKHDLRITGDFYNFLNYGRMYRGLTPEEKAKYSARAKIPKKRLGFPGFVDGQYWNFKIDEFIANNGLHLCKTKARRKGYSYMRGSQAANTLNLNKNLTVVLAAYELKYLTDDGATSYMVKTNLDWYEDNTIWRRFYLSEQLEGIELGYRKSTKGNKKYGFRSKLLSVGCRANESAVVGKDAYEIDFEEAGKFSNLNEVLGVTTSTTEDGDTNTGTIRIYGTGGTKDANWHAFSSIFYDPIANEMMAFENVFDDNKRHSVCGFFHGQYWGYFPYMEDGNSLILDAYDKDKARKDNYSKNNDIGKSTIFKGQRANKPQEAFLNTRDNIFASEVLNDHVMRLQHDPEVQIWEDGLVVDNGDNVIFKTNETLRAEGNRIHPFIEEYPIKKDTDIRGCIRIFQHPYKQNGIVPENTYFITYDPVGTDIDKSNLTIRHSLNSFKVWMYPENNTPFKGKRLMAAYAGRYDRLAQTDRLLLRVCKYYNAKVLPEIDRGDIVKNFKQWNELNRLIKDPTSIIDKGKYPTNASYGMKIGSSTRKLEGLRQLKELLYEPIGVDDQGKDIYFLQKINDIAFLIELQNFYAGGNFDRISDAILAYYQFNVNVIRVNKNHNKSSRPNNRLLNRLLYLNE